MSYARVDLAALAHIYGKAKKKKRKKGKRSGAQKYVARRIKSKQVERNTSTYWTWRKKVFKRDKFTCQDCGAKGEHIELHAHHIKTWADYPELRTRLNNGKTLCKDCHILIHPWLDVDRHKDLKAIKRPKIILRRKSI